MYVIQNARKHGAWIAKRPDDYSSGPAFEGWRNGRSAADRPVRDAESVSPWLVRARTWLLSIGWKRHGLIDPRDVPASG